MIVRQSKWAFLMLLASIFLMLSSAEEIQAQPCNITPSFSFTQTNTCGIPRNFTFTNTSTGSLAALGNYSWRIDGVQFDTTISVASTPDIYTIVGPGNYTISLVATDTNNCQSTATQMVNITTGAPRVFGSQSGASHNPVWENCIFLVTSPDTFQIDVVPEDTLFNYTIIWGDGTGNASGDTLLTTDIIQHTYMTQGDFTIRIAIDQNGCMDTLVGTVINQRVPTVGIIGPTAGQNSGCAPHTVRFINNSSNTSPSTVFTWDFGDGTIVVLPSTTANDTIFHTYLSRPGQCNLTVTLEAENSCGVSTTTWAPVNIFDIDEAAIALAGGPLCAPNLTYTFNNVSALNCVPGLRRYYWDFGDGNNTGWITTQAPQTHTYATLGNYTVMLIDSNSCGVDTAFFEIEVNVAPQAGFTTNQVSGCAPLLVNFGDTSVGFDNNISWNFGDPASGLLNTDTIPNPSHTYNDPGNYTVTLTVTNACGTSTATRTIEAYDIPAVTFDTLPNGCAPYTANFNHTTANLSPTATFEWDFGDGTSSTTENPPTKTYNTSGTYTVKLKITDICGTDSLERTFDVYDIPTGDFAADTVCANDSTTFTNNSTAPAGQTITGYLWDFRDGSTSTQQNPKHVFTLGGTYEVVLRVTTDLGCIDYDTVSVLVDVAPTVSFVTNPTNICDSANVMFDGTVTTSLGTITSFTWDFDNGVTSSQQDTNIVYATPGSYNVSLSATNSLGCSTTTAQTVQVHPNPVPSFTPTSTCTGALTPMMDQSTVGFGNNIVQWDWDFDGDGIFDSTGQNSSYVFPNAGNYDVILRVNTNNNCTVQDTFTVTVNPLPAVNISVVALTLCRQDTFEFINNTTGAVNYDWDFGDGTGLITSSLATLEKAYDSADIFTARMIAESNQGCLDSADITVTVRPFPEALFAANDTISCAPATFSFTNQSTQANTYQWLVNGVPSTTLMHRPDTTVNLDGQTFTISLVAFNVYNCRPDTFTRTFQTLADPVADFVTSPDSGCGPLSVSFTNQSTGAISYSWNLGNGDTATSADTSSVYQASTTIDSVYSVRLIATNIAGCTDTTIQTVRVFPDPITQFTVQRTDSCGPFEVHYTNTSIHNGTGTINDMTFEWDFGNGQTSIAQNTSATFVAASSADSIYTTRLIGRSQFGCLDTAYQSIRVYPNATSLFTSDLNQGCGPLIVQFTNSSIPNDTGTIADMTFAWDFGNGVTATSTDAAVPFVSSSTQDSIYQVSLIAFSEHGCPDTLNQDIRIYPDPVAAFTVSTDEGCGPLTVQFTNNSIPNDTGTIADMTFIWDFGNGTTSTARDTVISFLADPVNDTSYVVTLTAFSEHGCIAIIRDTILVHPRPIEAFTADQTIGCYPMEVNFMDQSINGDTYYWDFGDGDTASLQNPAHTFASRPLLDTVYTVRMVPTSPFGCLGDTASLNITVRYDPVADFITNPDSICNEGNISFFNQSLGGNSFQWDFGDGTSSFAINPIHFFNGNATQDTTYQISLIVTNPYGCRDTTSGSIKVMPLPDPIFTTSTINGCHPLTVGFNNNSQRAVSYFWDFSDGTTSIVSQPTHTFTNITLVDRSYRVTLRATSQSACEDTVSRVITVHPLPTANFSFTRLNNCDRADYQFSHTSVGANTFSWDFGDGGTGTGPNPIHTFPTSLNQDTTFTVRLIVNSINNCADTITRQVTVPPIVIASFFGGPTDACEFLNVAFTNVSRNGNQYFWEFGDGFSSTQFEPAHTYPQAGLYDVQLVAVDIHGCADTLRRPNYITVHETPSANFLANPTYQIMPNNTVQFTDLSLSSTPLTWTWDFGDSDGSTNQNPAHTYNDSGTYVIQLAVTNGFCSDTISRTVRIDPPLPIADFTFDPGTGCAPHTVNFVNQSQHAASYRWFFGDGKQSTEVNPSNTYIHPGTYTVSLIATGFTGVDDTTKENIIVVHENPIAGFRADPLEAFLPNARVTFINLSFDGDQFLWRVTTPEGELVFSDTAEFPVFTFTEPGLYDVQLIVTNQFGCVDSFFIPEYIQIFREGIIHVPTSFTPNQDGRNDIFIPVQLGVVPETYLFQVFNRWGEKVFETTDMNEGWNGRMLNTGKEVQLEAYIWQVSGRFFGGENFTKFGTVTLLR